MSRAWSSLAVASLVGVLVGCGSDVEGVETWDDGTAEQTEQLEGCEAFRPYSAALGALTVACRGTITTNQYMVVDPDISPTDLDKRRTLTRCQTDGKAVKCKFNDCPADPQNAETLLQEIDELLGLQRVEVRATRDPRTGAVILTRDPSLSGMTACLTRSWQTWQLDMSAAAINTCPTFRKAESFNVPSLEAPYDKDPTDDEYAQFYSTLQYSDILPDLPAVENPREPPKGEEIPPEKYPWLGKSHAFYEVGFPTGQSPNEGCKDALSCAHACAKAFDGFTMEKVRHEKYFVGDPSWWVANEYAPGSNPYMVPGFYHPMSFEAPVPMGVIYGHRARVGEACSKWAGGYSHYVLGLSLYCFSPSLCYSKCSGPAPVVYSDGVAF